jgi:hypothetical protein
MKDNTVKGLVLHHGIYSGLFLQFLSHPKETNDDKNDLFVHFQ